MKGTKSFIAGFSFSLISMSFVGQLYSPLPRQNQYPQHDIKIDLFKKHDIAPIKLPPLKKVSKYSIISTAKADPIDTLQETPAINGIDDDEILSVNIDNFIPIDYEEITVPQQAEVLQGESDNLSAMLPESITYNNEPSELDSPWEIAKGSKYTKNKKLLEEFNTTDELTTLSDNTSNTLGDTSEISYKVAEKIKQSIIFPIPSEILNDEELVPTFAKNRKKAQPQSNVQPTAKPTSLPTNTNNQTESSLKIINKTPTQETVKETNSKGLLDSLSSWFTPEDEKNEDKPKARHKIAPSYSSQEVTSKQKTVPSSNEEFASFYETLQETTRHHQQNKILPSELKLNFQPGRAEISGQTLRWIKAFSEAAQNENTFLQVRLDASTPSDIQKKRLNLLYSIFINNGVDTKKIDTIFAPTEPNTFIIRSLTYN